MYQARQITDRDAWDSALLRLPAPHTLQSWDWGAFKERWGWRATRLLWTPAGDTRPVAAVQLLERRLSHSPLSIAYAPKGPLLAFENTDLLDTVLSALQSMARDRHNLFLKIDADVYLGSGPDEAAPEPVAARVLAALEQRRWQFSADQIQFRNTVVVDLTPDEETLLGRMKPKTRYNVRLAERHSVDIHPGSEADLGAFYALYQATSQRDGFLIRSSDYYRDVWSHFLATGRAHLLLAKLAGETIAGLLLFVLGPTAWYMVGASSNAHREHMPSYRLQWAAMRLAKQVGCTRYDMWGAPDRFDDTDRMWGVYRFKTGFGGTTVRGLGAYDFAPSPLLYSLYGAVMPRLLAMMRRRHSSQGPASAIAWQ